jgi:glycosyltransferase involved in cell wall biosynthesis
MSNLKFSIITPTLNSEKVVEKTIESVLNQDYPNIEYIIVDGASTDSTLEILNRYGDKIRWISEPDSGPPAAINKGLKMASGDIIGIIPASDYYEPGVFKKIADFFSNFPDIDLVYGDFYILDGDKKTLIRLRQVTYREVLRSSRYVHHQASFCRRTLLEKAGLWDETLNIAADYEWIIRLFSFANASYLPLAISTYRFDKDSWSVKNFRIASRQRWEAAKRHGAKFYHPVFWQSVLSSQPWLFNLIKRLPGYNLAKNIFYAVFGR